jgi:hypothetical protein
MEAAENLQFKGVPLHKKNRIDDPPISPVAFYERLELSIQKTLLSKEDIELSRCGRILDSNNWPANSKDNIVYGEEEIRTLATRFQLSKREVTRAFREYMKYREEMPKELSRFRCILHTIAISTSECEGGFSQMNLIVTPGRSSLLVKTVASLLFIIILGPPLTLSGQMSICNRNRYSSAMDKCRYMIESVSFAVLRSYFVHISLFGTVCYTNVFRNVFFLPPPAIWKPKFERLEKRMPFIYYCVSVLSTWLYVRHISVFSYEKTEI